MKWFVNLSTKIKLLVGFGLMIILLAALSATSYTGIRGFQSMLKNLFEVEYPFSLEIAKLRNNLNRERVLLIRMMDSTGRTEYDILNKEIKEIDKENNERFEKISKLAGNSQDIMPLVNELTDLRKAFKNIRDTQTIPMIYAGKGKEAKTLFLGPQFELYEKMRNTAIKISDLSEGHAKKIMELTNRKVKISTYTFVIAGILAIIIGIAMALYITRIIAGPLKKISGAAERVAYGDMTVRIPSDNRTDEVGTLMLSFGMMVESLKMVTREIRDAVNVLASSSSGILETTTQVSSGTSEVQKSLIEVTTKVEEGKRIAKDIKSLAEQSNQEKALTLSLKQLAELNEVASAVDNIKQTIAQNVESINQAETTAQNLNALGQKLKNIVEQFKV